MGRNCGCPIAFNVFVGLFLAALAIISWFKLLDIYIPIWLSVIIFILGLLSIFLNLLNRSYANVEELKIE